MSFRSRPMRPVRILSVAGASIALALATLVAGPSPAAHAVDGCWVYSVENPHRSTSNPGQVDAKSWAKCSKAVASMNIYTQLYVNGVKYGSVRTSPYSPVAANTGYRGWSHLLPCKTGSWRAEVWLNGVQYGGNVFASIGKAYSNLVHITCAGGGGGGGGR